MWLYGRRITPHWNSRNRTRRRSESLSDAVREPESCRMKMGRLRNVKLTDIHSPIVALRIEQQPCYHREDSLEQGRAAG